MENWHYKLQAREICFWNSRCTRLIDIKYLQLGLLTLACSTEPV